jgi:hypothetical protein
MMTSGTPYLPNVPELNATTFNDFLIEIPNIEHFCHGTAFVIFPLVLTQVDDVLLLYVDIRKRAYTPGHYYVQRCYVSKPWCVGNTIRLVEVFEGARSGTACVVCSGM